MIITEQAGFQLTQNQLKLPYALTIFALAIYDIVSKRAYVENIAAPICC